MMSYLEAPRHVLERVVMEIGYQPKQVIRMITRQLRYIALYEAENDRSAWDNFDGDCVDDYETAAN
jgi:hypothetical protein